MGDLTKAISKALRDYRCRHTAYDRHMGMPLADMLTPPGDEQITKGLEEVEELAAHLAFHLSTLSPVRDGAGVTEGWVLVPREPTVAMQNAAVDVDSFKLGDISPLGFRISPQMLFSKVWAAMLAAAPKPPAAPLDSGRTAEGRE